MVIYATSLDEHTRKLKELLRRLKDARLILQPEKLHFLKKEMTYLGHIKTRDAVKPDPRIFLELIGYYRKFIPDFTKREKPLTYLLQERIPFKWNETEQTTF